jgi:ParB/RepB/Spo0J family partition protein
MIQSIDIPLDRLKPGANNARKVFVGIPELALSIQKVGLLENLIVVPDPESPGNYFIRGGERRWRAMQILVQQLVWDTDELVPCRVLSTDGDLESLAGNGAEAITPWGAGGEYARQLDKGLTQEQIAQAVGKSQSYVSLCVRIHRGLGEKVIQILNRLNNSSPSMIQLGHLAEIIDRDTLKPDEEKQIQWIQAFLAKPARRKGPFKRKGTGSPAVFTRLQKLKDMTIPLEHVAVVEAIIRYLTYVDSDLNLPESSGRPSFTDDSSANPSA